MLFTPVVRIYKDACSKFKTSHHIPSQLPSFLSWFNAFDPFFPPSPSSDWDILFYWYSFAEKFHSLDAVPFCSLITFYSSPALYDLMAKRARFQFIAILYFFWVFFSYLYVSACMIELRLLSASSTRYACSKSYISSPALLSVWFMYLLSDNN